MTSVGIYKVEGRYMIGQDSSAPLKHGVFGPLICRELLDIPRPGIVAVWRAVRLGRNEHHVRSTMAVVAHTVVNAKIRASRLSFEGVVLR